MSDKSTSSLDILKRELSRLKSFTDTIGTAKASAVESQEAAEAAIRAAEVVHEQQKALLGDLQREHQKSIDGQSELLRTNSRQWEAALKEQLAVALEEYGKQTAELEKVAATLRQDGQKHGDVLTGVSDRLQVIMGSLTAFRDAMNAARFADRLENIGTQQDVLHHTAQASQQVLVNHFATLEQSLLRQQESVDGQLQAVQQQLRDVSTRNLLVQGIIAAGVIALLVLHFIKVG